MTFRVRHKIDANQPAIVKALREAGYAVQHLNQGGGVADLLVAEDHYGPKRNNRMWLLEVKEPDAKLTPAQVKWIDGWPTPVYVVHTPKEALDSVRGTP